MNHRKHGLGLLGLMAVVALGVMAFASTAQAVETEFLVNGKLALAATLGGAQVGTGTLLLPALKTEVNCTGFTVQEGKINTGLDANGKLLYEGCTALVLELPTKTELPGCQIIVNEASGDLKTHISATALILPVEFADGTYGILAEDIKALILFLKGKGCVLPLDNTVSGDLCFRIDGNNTAKPLILTNEKIQTECPERVALKGAQGAGVKDSLLYGAQTAFVDGTAHVFLLGEHNGQNLGVLLQ